MPFDYEAMRSMATNLLSDAGGSFTLLKPDKKVYNEKTKKTEMTWSSYQGICTKKAYSAEAVGGLSNIISMGDVSFSCTMNDISVIPTEQKDKIIFEGVTYNILHVFSSDPSGKLVIVHNIHARKATSNG